MEKLVALHEPGREYVYPLDRFRLAIRLRVLRRPPPPGPENDRRGMRCRVLYWNRNLASRGEAETAEMSGYARDDTFDYYEAVIGTAKATRYLLYYFRIDTADDDACWQHAYGLSGEEPEDGFYEYCYTNDGEAHQVPEWAQGTVYYQIFPDRFENGNRDNDPPGTAAWGSAPTRESVMGGDLAGIRQRLPYLSELGVGALYLNPIFLSPSNHKYDTTNYGMVDPVFGTLEELRVLVEACHRLGIRVLLDGVFHHCGYLFAPFQDALQRGEASAYAGWFYLDGFPVDPQSLNYETIGYYWPMPKLNLSHPGAREHMLRVAARWLTDAGIDGWRLDVAEEVDYTFRQQLRRVVKAIRPDALLLGEAWRENRDLLRGDQMDAVMNYVFRDAVVDFIALGRIDVRAFDSRLNRFLGVYPRTVRDALYNLLGSHDTARMLTLCGGDARLMKLAVAFQFCFPGSPAIYYGDEVGLEGGGDPDCRKAMEWRKERQHAGLLAWHKRWIDLRKQHRTLASGGFMSLYCGGESDAPAALGESDNPYPSSAPDASGLYGFMRYSGDNARDADARLYAVLNRSPLRRRMAMPVVPSPDQCPHMLDLLEDGRRLEVRAADDRRDHWNADLVDCRGTVELVLEPYQFCLLQEGR